MREERLSNFDFSVQFKGRTKAYSLRIIKLFQSLPMSTDAQILGKQLLRSATSVAANYRAACRGRSNAKFISKIGIALEEADESLFWLELLEESGIIQAHRLTDIKKESDEITAILTSIKSSYLKRR